MIAFTLDTPPKMNEALFSGGVRQSHFQLFDSISELADFGEGWKHTNVHSVPETCAYVGIDRAFELARAGDLSGVVRSDALLATFESMEIASAHKKWFDDVVGAVPNVQAFIAGQPCSMRRRIRSESEFSPLTIVVDIGAASHVTRGEIATRGSVVLALLRIISQMRPVELWIGAGLDADRSRNASQTFARVDTSPLDLARASYMLTHPAAIRQVLWSCAGAKGFHGITPYGAGQRHALHTEEILAPVFTGDALILPRLNHHEDESIAAPEKWLRKKISEYGIREI